jgi:AcrR family transcriptional regulator
MSPRIGLDLPTILQAAAEIADTHGIEAVTLASLAKKLKIRPPSLYNHVDGLHGLRKKLAVHGLEQLNSILTRAVIGRSGDDAVRALGEAYVSFARSHPGLYEATLLAPDLRDPDVQRAGSESVDLVVRVLNAYGLEDEAALHAVRGLRSILHGFASLEQRGGFGLPLDLDLSLRLLIDSFLAGIHTIKQNVKPDLKSG